MTAPTLIGRRDGTPYRALVLTALALGGFAIGTTEFAIMSLLPYFTEALGVSEPRGGLVISAYALGVVVGAPVIAVFGARASRRHMLMGLMLAFAAANLLSALAPSFGWMVAFRFLSGLPHGAYFGIAALVAASLVGPGRRAQAVSLVMLGLTIATVVGVPFANWMGHAIGWRWAFVMVGAIALLTVGFTALFAPRDPGDRGASPLRELGALRRPQVWMTLGTGAIGFGGMFAVYTYAASTLLEVTGLTPEAIPMVFLVFGLGMTVGNLVCAWLADRALMPAIGGVLLWSAAALALYPFAAGAAWSIMVCVFLIGCGGGLGAMLQTRLMDVADDAQTLAAALNHCAFNTANALGPWLGGMAIAAGYGWTSTGWVGCALALGGAAIWAISFWFDRRRVRRTTGPAAACPS